MANDIIGVSIKAFEEFEDAFKKFHDGLNKTEQGERRVVDTTESINKAMSTMIKILSDMAQEQKKGTDTTEKFYEAFRQFVSAEKAVEQQTEKVNAAMKAQGVEGKQAQSVLDRLEHQIDDTSRAMTHNAHAAHQMHDGASQIMMVMGEVGILYAFGRGLQEILRIGIDLEQQLTKVAAITNESVNNFSGFIYGNKGSLFAPAEQAKAMIDLGAAGLQSAEMLKALPEVFDLATAGLVNLEQAVPPVLNVIKTFERPIEESGQIVDAFVEAANRSALQVEDLSLSMAMSSAAAKLAGMDYRELITTLMILRDAGLQASDAGTSIKSALLAMMNPSEEAIDYMDQFGISIYDAQGNMKSWADIVGEFERGLTGLTEKEKNLVLSTVAGSDGIRALTLSMGRGNEFIRQTTTELQNADGAARDVAAAMEQTFDATLKKTTNNLQLMAATIFNDAEPAMTSL
jgi:TP901 family phage tail tape measure protein